MAVGVRQEVDMAHSGTVYTFSLHTAYCHTLYTYRGTYGPSSLVVKNPVNAKGTDWDRETGTTRVDRDRDWPTDRDDWPAPMFQGSWVLAVRRDFSLRTLTYSPLRCMRHLLLSVHWCMVPSAKLLKNQYARRTVQVIGVTHSSTYVYTSQVTLITSAFPLYYRYKGWARTPIRPE